jgi:hypothetical protein
MILPPAFFPGISGHKTCPICGDSLSARCVICVLGRPFLNRNVFVVVVSPIPGHNAESYFLIGQTMAEGMLKMMKEP